MKKIGVIVARFQVPTLHEGHVELLRSVASKSDVTVVFLGYKSHQPDLKNPYPLEVRKGMLTQTLEKENLTNIVIDCLLDHPESNEGWSEDLDEKIASHIETLKKETGEDSHVTLYGSRDSFIKYYSGKHATEELKEKIVASGTDMRNKILERSPSELTTAHREGMLYGLKAVYPVGMSVVDIGVYRKEGEGYEYLLGRKPRENAYRVFGGFFDVTADMTLEEAALRELREEAGDIEVKDPVYLMSTKVNDWRYVDNQHKIVTAFFTAEYVQGKPKASDDIEELMWVKERDMPTLPIAESHKVLVEKLRAYTKSLN